MSDASLRKLSVTDKSTRRYQRTGDKCPPELAKADWTASAMTLWRMSV